MNAAEIANALGGAKRNGAGWYCRCPAHDDNSPSLAITEKDGKVLFTCRAGCDQKTLLAALRGRGLWSEPGPAKAAQIAAVYNYRDAAGELRYQVVRRNPKKFFQRRPNGGPDTFINNMQGVAPLPYRLPDLLADPDATVFIAEGEKDCDNLGERGFVATCNHGGAGKWRKEISHWLAGRHVVILPDNDEAGQAHATDVAQKLADVTASIRVLDLPGLPPKGDVSDWLAGDGTADALEVLAKAAPAIGANEREPAPMPQIIDAAEDIDAIPPRAWLLGNTFCRRFLSGLIGLGGVGKSALRLTQALCLASGRELTREHVFHRTRVLLVSLEDGIDELRRRVRAAMLYHGVSRDDLGNGWLYLWAPIGLKFAELKDPQSREMKAGELAELLRRQIADRAIGLVSIDPFIKAHAADENDNAAIDAVCTMMTSLAIQMNIAVDVLHHDSKTSAEPGGSTRGRGASSFRDAGRLLYTVTPMTSAEAAGFGLSEAERRALIRLDSAKVNIAPPSAEARWFKIVGVPLDNGTPDYPRGDNVQTIEPWQPPDFWAAITVSIANEILDQIERGLPGGSRYSGAAQAGKRAAWPLVQQRLPQLTEKQSRSVIATWLKNEQISHEKYDDPVARKPLSGIVVSGQRPG